MFGIQFIQFDSMTYVVHFKHGKIKREGRGLSFYYFAPRSSISAIPLGSRDIQFIFNETARDFQTVSIQGQITYKIENPKQLAELLDFTLGRNRQYKEDNFEKLNQRLNNEAQTATTSFIQGLNLKEAIRSANEIESKIFQGLQESGAVKLLGVEILSVDVLGVKPTPEMSKTREALQKEADQAIYERRSFAVEQERKIKESELNTEIAVQEKKKQIQEKHAEIQIKEEENTRKLREMRMNADMTWDEKRLVFIVREPFLSKYSRVDLTTGLISPEKKLILESFMPTNGVIFSDGIEADFLHFNSGSIAEIGIAQERALIVQK
jgi:hypothetical protein